MPASDRIGEILYPLTLDISCVIPFNSLTLPTGNEDRPT